MDRRLAVAVLVVLLAGCSGSAKVIEAGDVTVLVSERPDGGSDALGGGRLEVLDGCLGAGGAVVVWPHGTRVQRSDPLSVQVPGSGTVGLGDEVSFAGGMEHEPQPGEGTTGPVETSVGITVPATCAQHGVWVAWKG